MKHPDCPNGWPTMSWRACIIIVVALITVATIAPVMPSIATKMPLVVAGCVLALGILAWRLYSHPARGNR